MIIDMHCHLAPAKWAESKPMPPILTDVEAFFRRKEQAGISLSVIGNPMMNNPGTQQDDRTLDKIREYEDFAVTVIDRYPGRVFAFLGVNPFGGHDVLYEIEHAVARGGFKGVMINSSIDGEFLGSSKADEFWALIASLDIPIFIHPPALPAGSRGLHDFRLVEHVGRPCDVTLGLAAIIFAGVLERYPSLTLIGGMAGGGLAMLPGHLDVSYRSTHWQVGPGQKKQASRPPFVPESMGQAPHQLSQDPSQYVRRIYVDSCTYSVPAMMCNLAVYGSEHIIFGTDSPPINLPLETAIQLVKNLSIPEEDKENIFWKNAVRLLKLEGKNYS